MSALPYTDVAPNDTRMIQWNSSIPNTLGPESTVLISEMSSFQGLKLLFIYVRKYAEEYCSSRVCPK